MCVQVLLAALRQYFHVLNLHNLSTYETDTTSVRGFHVTSYEANFASHRTCNRDAGPLPKVLYGKYNKMSKNSYLD